MPLSKYTCHIVCGCPTGYKLHITGYASKRSKPIDFELISNMHIFYVFDKHIYFLTSMTTYIFLVWKTYFVFCIYANNLGNCTHVYNAHEVKVDSLKYFTFVSSMFSFTSMIPLVFHVWQSYLVIFAAIYKHFLFGSHISSL